MTDIKPGMIAYLKTTEEPCFVLDVKPLDRIHTLVGCLSGVGVTVRRPVMDDKGGVGHKVDTFLIEELESKEDASVRKVNEMQQLKAQFDAERQAKTSSDLAMRN